jgi:hypothetical protein
MKVYLVHQANPSLTITSESFECAYTVYRRLVRVKEFLDTINEEFIDAKEIKLTTIPNDSFSTDEDINTLYCVQLTYDLASCKTLCRLSQIDDEDEDFHNLWQEKTLFD